MHEEITKKILEYMDGTKDFLLEQAPDVVQQLITWAIFNSCLQIIFCISLITISWKIFKRRSFPDFIDEDAVVPFIRIFFAVAGVICIFAILSYLQCLAKCLIAPKLFIIQSLTSK